MFSTAPRICAPSDAKLLALEGQIRHPRLCRATATRLWSNKENRRLARCCSTIDEGDKSTAPIPAPSSWACAKARRSSAWASARLRPWKSCWDPRRCRGERIAWHGDAGPRCHLDQLSAIAMAKSMVSWHQRHGFCANCGTRSTMTEGGWKRDCPNCKAEHFPRTDPVVIMLVTHGDRILLGRQKQFMPGMYSCLAGFVEAAETIEDAVRREDFRGIRHPLHRRELLHDAALALPVIPDDRLHRARHQRRRWSSITQGTRGRPLVRPVNR